jgi:hypothetical protein
MKAQVTHTSHTTPRSGQGGAPERALLQPHLQWVIRVEGYDFASIALCPITQTRKHSLAHKVVTNISKDGTGWH